MGSKGGSSFNEDVLQANTSVISMTETKRRVHGQPTIIQRQIFFQGVVYQIEEELYSDSEHSSVYTSDDDFEVEKNIQRRFKQVNPLRSTSNFQLSQTGNMLKKLNTSKTDAFDTGRVSPIEEEEAPTPQLGGSKQSLIASNSKKTALKDSSAATLDDKSPKVAGKDSQRRDSMLSRKVSIKEEVKDETL